MGQTLTHGVYLPDEGERNCYNGLAANWQLLDNSVGTIAEHTTALAGKAPAAHTHTKSNITDFPAYGTTAGTICEGNDSRLSDARTPVAHTHTKSDITDLFNSANTWTADNTFSGTNSFTAANINIKSSNFSLGDTVSSSQVKRFQWYDASNNRYACIAVNYATDKSVWIDFPLRTKNTEGTSFIDKTIRFQVKPDNTSAFLPVTNSVTDLGSSSYQWNNVYSKGYYYNGTPWGLDQINVWTAWQTEEHSTEPLIRLRRPNLQIGDAIPQSTQIIGTIPFADKDNLNLGLIAVRDDTNGNTFLTLVARQRYDSNGRAHNGTQYESRIDVGIDSSKNLYLRPNSNNKIDLGTSTNKWKTLNGINPGALSLPNTATTDASGDIIPPSGESSINLSGSANTFTPSKNGWLTLAINCASGNCIIVRQNTSNRYTLNYMQGYVSGQTNIYLTLPVLAGVTYYIFLYATSFVMARFALCQGNV